MIKEMKGWKVLSSSRMSCRTSMWGLQKDKWSIHYPIGKKVRPRVKGTKIFFFHSQTNALVFSNNKDLIVPCIAYNATKVKWIGSISLKIDIFCSFWKLRSKSNAKAKAYAPKGTYLADAIKCLK